MSQDRAGESLTSAFRSILYKNMHVWLWSALFAHETHMMKNYEYDEIWLDRCNRQPPPEPHQSISSLKLVPAKNMSVSYV